VEPVTPEAGRPVRALAAFAAVIAEPGETAEARLTVPARAFARFDETVRAWVWPPGEFAVRIGRSSADLRLSVRVKSLFFRTDRPYRGREGLVPSWYSQHPVTGGHCSPVKPARHNRAAAPTNGWHSLPILIGRTALSLVSGVVCAGCKQRV
jgi:hypothetical protein